MAPLSMWLQLTGCYIISSTEETLIDFVELVDIHLDSFISCFKNFHEADPGNSILHVAQSDMIIFV